VLQADDVELLLVEDSASDEELTVHALRRYNLTNKLHVVRDGEEALDFIFCRGDYAARKIDNGPKVVLLDIKLPKVDGLAVLRQIKEDERTKHIPVVLLTSSQEETDVIAGYEFGANSYIVKPVGFIELTEAVREIGMYWLILNKPPVEAS
jgi:DNA-binding response OmpR family regulator